MQPPSIGRVVRYQGPGREFAAIIVHVFNATHVNLLVLDENGVRAVHRVPFQLGIGSWHWPPPDAPAPPAPIVDLTSETHAISVEALVVRLANMAHQVGEIHAQVEAAGATPMLLHELERSKARLEAACVEAGKLFD